MQWIFHCINNRIFSCGLLSRLQGPRCQKKLCDSNPCQNGATCVARLEPQIYDFHHQLTKRSVKSMLVEKSLQKLPYNDTTLPALHGCLCPLGFTGALCQFTINITRPAFRPFFDYDYSSYALYDPVPNFSNWVQLKFHFVPSNMSQVSIMLYSGAVVRPTAMFSKRQVPDGSSNPTSVKNIDPTVDFMSVTFVQGFIMLTWNMGSGTQRIFTPSRVDPRLNIVS